MGILKNPAVSLVTVSGKLLDALRTNGTVSYSVPAQRRNSAELCQEEEVLYKIYLLTDGSLAYRFKGKKCSGQNPKVSKQCRYGGMSIGTCVDNKSIAVVPVFDRQGTSFDKTFEFISSCKCKV